MTAWLALTYVIRVTVGKCIKTMCDSAHSFFQAGVVATTFEIVVETLNDISEQMYLIIFNGFAAWTRKSLHTYLSVLDTGI